MTTEFNQFFTDEVNAQWTRESNDNETRETIIEMDGITYLVKRETVIQVGSDGSQEARVITVTEKHDGYDVVVMPGDPMFHAAKIKSANILYGE